ncbi:MAG: VTT domain-containing protein [Microbacterium sp.]|nr:VTT domain-containing protein [Microbacterium sp.]
MLPILHPSSPVRWPFTGGWHDAEVIDDVLAAIGSGPWALPLLFGLVFADAFLVVLPGETTVTAFGALAVASGSPPLFAVVSVAAAAAFCGDACCYLVGRRVGLERWRWMRHRRVRAALAWAGSRLQRGAATVVFTARFIPFARLAVNLTAGASRVAAPRYLPVVGIAAIGWATYQAVVGAVVAWLLPGGPLVAVVVSIVVAVALGVVTDAIAARLSRRRGRVAAAPPE